MNRRARTIFFALSGFGLLALLAWGLRGLPLLGHYRGPYGDVLNAVAVYERHATDIVTAVNFDYRGFDTLGEEFILFISATGVTLLLRKEKQAAQSRASPRPPAEGGGENKQGGEAEEQEDRRDEAAERHVPGPSEAARVLTLGLVGPLVLFGIYIVTHGQLTPGGGFQGGVILATAPLLVYLAGNWQTFRRITSHTLIEVAGAIGAAGYALVGLAAMALGAAYLQNVLPLGVTGAINSGGTIALIDLAVGLEVSSAFVLVLYAFLEETLARLSERED